MIRENPVFKLRETFLERMKDLKNPEVLILDGTQEFPILGVCRSMEIK